MRGDGGETGIPGRRDRRRRRVVVTCSAIRAVRPVARVWGALAGTGMIVAMLTGAAVMCVPPWADTVRAGTYAVGLLGVAMVAGGVVMGSRERGPKRSAADVHGLRAAPRDAALTAAVLSLLVGVVGCAIAGQEVIAAQTFSSSTAVVPAIETQKVDCRKRRFTHLVTFDLDGHRTTARYPDGIATSTYPGPGEPFVVDRRDPRKAMTQKAFEYGTGSGRAWMAAFLALLVGGPALTWGVEASRRRRLLRKLQEEQILHVAAAPDGDGVRLVTFADYSQARFTQTPELADLLRRRMVQDKPPRDRS